ncbi:hypothetical protein PACTADRAFT_223 [Pachysolen tannophilus NRRL Y-2460]|uniref:RING-type domain-containing protein n=1 Tax=Pachysolen tannophilus NRRL Y-2460 TaxID=669874 RepID=A0A1E4U1D5_PACTA|nr:hypothetical protein PACTADRAFT_223 [Pachysolen tannophilus NRRL Y-2460]
MILPNISKVYSIAMLVNFLQFLIDGNYPTIAFRFSNIKLKPSPGSSSTALNSPENISYEFQNRQLVWNTLTEFLLFTLPILKLPKFSTRLINLVMGKNRNLKTDSATAEISAYGNTSLKECAICLLQEGNNATIGNNNDHSGLTSGNHNLITNPYITNCGHCYCYICILSKLEQYRGEKDHWKCLRCGQDVKWCKKFDDVDTKYIICNITTIGKQSSENIEKRNEQDNTEANAAEFINNTTEDEDEPENEPENDTGDDAEDDTEPANNGGFFVQ